MRALLFPLLAVSMLTVGCTTMTPEERRAADEAECRSYGFTRKNDAFAECLQRIELDRRAAYRDRTSMSRDPWFYAQPRVVVVERRGKK